VWQTEEKYATEGRRRAAAASRAKRRRVWRVNVNGKVKVERNSGQPTRIVAYEEQQTAMRVHAGGNATPFNGGRRRRPERNMRGVWNEYAVKKELTSREPVAEKVE